MQPKLISVDQLIQIEDDAIIVGLNEHSASTKVRQPHRVQVHYSHRNVR